MNQEISNRRFAIFPSIGISRVGNSDDYFLSPEMPSQIQPSGYLYKDSQGRIKKQVARFRIYELDNEDNPIQEITSDNGEIHWRAHLANQKAAWYQFNNAMDLGEISQSSKLRNAHISKGERKRLVINPGSISIEGRSKNGPQYAFNRGTWFNKNISLGELRTDELGRLMVFGGNGICGSIEDIKATTFANNDGWYDDTSDGTVRATVIIDGQEFEALPSMVAVVPPNYAPGLTGVVTMYDVVLNTFTKQNWIPKPEVIIFEKHIYPIFDRLCQLQWVNYGFFFLFGYNSPSDFSNEELINRLSDPTDEQAELRKRVFAWFRDPSSRNPKPELIPPNYGDAYNDVEIEERRELSVTELQYEWLFKWSQGDFISIKGDATVAWDNLLPKQQAEYLTQAALDECLGGPFHPGIELTWIMRVPSIWQKAFRLRILPEGEMPKYYYGKELTPKIALGQNGPLNACGPGSLTRWLGIPWQTDEASCHAGYDTSTYLPLPSFWSARVPNFVLSDDGYKRLSEEKIPLGQRLKHFHNRAYWLRDFGPIYEKRINRMTQEWFKLGVITMQHAKFANDEMPNIFWIESQRFGFKKVDSSYIQVQYAEGLQQPFEEIVDKLLEAESIHYANDLPDAPLQLRPEFGRGEI